MHHLLLYKLTGETLGKKKVVYIAKYEDIKPGRGRLFRINSKQIALFNKEGKIFAVQNKCPHQHADLADGYLKDGKLFCSMHHWAFYLETGAYAFNDSMKLATYNVQVEDGNIFLEV